VAFRNRRNGVGNLPPTPLAACAAFFPLTAERVGCGLERRLLNLFEECTAFILRQVAALANTVKRQVREYEPLHFTFAERSCAYREIRRVQIFRGQTGFGELEQP
jgi:hypothetical protein